MGKYYITYGTDGDFPGGWTEIEAPEYGIMYKVFKAFHPAYNYCEIMDEEAFLASGMEDGNLGHGCWEKITVAREMCDDGGRAMANAVMINADGVLIEGQHELTAVKAEQREEDESRDD